MDKLVKVGLLRTVMEWVKSKFVRLDGAEIKKLEKIADEAEVNKIDNIRVNGAVLAIASKAVDIKVPVKVSELTNDQEYQTKAEVQKLINSAPKLVKEIVSQLPATGKENVLYLKGPAGTGNNIYEEFMWIGGKWEKTGDTKTDLTGYLKETDLKFATLNDVSDLMV